MPVLNLCVVLLELASEIRGNLLESLQTDGEVMRSAV